MKSENNIEIIFFSCDLVLIQIVNRLFDKFISGYSYTTYDSFIDSNSIDNSDSHKLIIVDDLIIGTSSYELMSFLRLNKKITCPIVYVGVSEHDNEKKSLAIGANYFVSKPFNPNEVTSLLKSILIKNDVL